MGNAVQSSPRASDPSISPWDAAQRMICGLRNPQFEIAFPWQPFVLMKTGRADAVPIYVRYARTFLAPCAAPLAANAVIELRRWGLGQPCVYGALPCGKVALANFVSISA
jgi:hypothetical protein